jgi:hypothetical protein
MKHKDLIALIFIIGNKEKLKIKYICLKYGNCSGKSLINYVGERAREPHADILVIFYNDWYISAGKEPDGVLFIVPPS